jgi:hypothetical protein
MRSGPALTVAVPPPSASVRLLAVAMAPALAAMVAIDLRIRGSEGLLLHGIADATAHLLTALIIFAAIRALGFRVSWVMAAMGAVVADFDYLLIRLDLVESLGDSSRGLLHTPGPALGLILLGLIFPWGRTFVISLGIGMLTHIFRDSATAATAAMWPLSDDIFHLRYSLYLILLAMCTTIVTGAVALYKRLGWRHGPGADLDIG